MKWFSWFGKTSKRRTRRKPQQKRRTNRSNHSLSTLRADLINLQSQTTTIHALLDKHEQQLCDHAELLEQHTKQFTSLEDRLTVQTAPPVFPETLPTSRPISSTSPDHAANRSISLDRSTVDLERFSDQEKRILAVFLKNQDMALSYVDIAKALSRSANTIKNQVRQLRMKADLFEKTIDQENRNRFRLKEGLKLRKYLNLGPTVDRPGRPEPVDPSTDPDQTDDESA